MTAIMKLCDHPAVVSATRELAERRAELRAAERAAPTPTAAALAHVAQGGDVGAVAQAAAEHDASGRVVRTRLESARAALVTAEVGLEHARADARRAICEAAAVEHRRLVWRQEQQLARFADAVAETERLVAEASAASEGGELTPLCWMSGMDGALMIEVHRHQRERTPKAMKYASEN